MCAGFSWPQHPELLRNCDFAKRADGQAGQRNAGLNAGNHPVPIAQ
jgi:hypothetical protein